MAVKDFGMKPIAADRNPVFCTGVRNASRATDRAEASATRVELPVQPRRHILLRRNFNDAAQLAPVFGGDSGGVDGKRVDVVGFEFGAEAGRAVIGERDAVDDELGLIFGASGMKDGIAFVEPAGLGDDEIGERTAGERGRAVGYSFRVEVVDRGGAFRIEERGGRGDVYGGTERGDG